jgi:hypothetical protein
MAQNEKGQNEKGGKKNKEEGTAAVLRRLADEVSRLREDVEGIRAGNTGGSSAKRNDKAVSFAYVTSSGDNMAEGEAILRDALTALEKPEDLLATLATADEARVARLGFALSSGPKVALMRLLLEQGGQTAAFLGEKTGLSTGSLYHHLRELIHAEAILQESRNRYTLTATGRRTAVLLFTLAALKG